MQKIKNIITLLIMKILGVDPGFGRCGFAILDASNKSKPTLCAFGTITTEPNSPFPARLHELATDFESLFKKWEPEVVSIEDLFFGTNTTTAMRVAGARGVILLLAERAGCRVVEPKPVELKLSFTGNGKANKAEMKKMAKLQFGLEKNPKIDDAADAIAAAMWALHA